MKTELAEHIKTLQNGKLENDKYIEQKGEGTNLNTNITINNTKLFISLTFYSLAVIMCHQF
jgi:hypothetical protein